MAAHVLRAERGPSRRPVTRAATCLYAHAQAHCPYPCISPENSIDGSFVLHRLAYRLAHGRTCHVQATYCTTTA